LEDRSRLQLIIAAFEAATSRARLLILGYEGSIEEREYVEQVIAASTKRSSVDLVINPDCARFREGAGSAAALIVTGLHASVVDASVLAAGMAAVPVITTTDAGELARVIEDDASGYVVNPQPMALAQAMDQVLADPRSAERRGKALSARLGKLLPSWDTIAMELTR
jgi:glycosyltransferase involved in cell wall biosynthesis